MKIIAIGDTHGRQDWKEILKEDLSTIEKIIFIGDYFDTHDDISQDQQIENFKQILEFKKSNPDKTILLIGNHDYHYMGDQKIKYSGFESARAFDIKELLTEALQEQLIQAVYFLNGEQPVLFSHAGVTKTWLNNNVQDWTLENIQDKINELFIYQPRKFEFTPGDRYSPYGDEICQTPIWVRPNSLMFDGFDKDVVQVVGHTQHKEITIYGKFIFIDCLDKKPKEFLTLS